MRALAQYTPKSVQGLQVPYINQRERISMARFENCLQCGKRLSGTRSSVHLVWLCLCSWNAVNST